MTINLTPFQPANCVLEPLSVVPTQVSSVRGASVESASLNRAVNTGTATSGYQTVTSYAAANGVPTTKVVPTWRTRGTTVATNGLTADLQPAASIVPSFAGFTGAAAVRFEAVGGAEAFGSVSAAAAAKQAHAKAMKSAPSAIPAAKRGAPPRRIPDLIP